MDDGIRIIRMRLNGTRSSAAFYEPPARACLSSKALNTFIPIRSDAKQYKIGGTCAECGREHCPRFRRRQHMLLFCIFIGRSSVTFSSAPFPSVQPIRFEMRKNRLDVFILLFACPFSVLTWGIACMWSHISQSIWPLAKCRWSLHVRCCCCCCCLVCDVSRASIEYHVRRRWLMKLMDCLFNYFILDGISWGLEMLVSRCEYLFL